MGSIISLWLQYRPLLKALVAMALSAKEALNWTGDKGRFITEAEWADFSKKGYAAYLEAVDRK